MAYDECGYYKHMIEDGKAVFNIEYQSHGGRVCSMAKQNGLITKYRSEGWHDC